MDCRRLDLSHQYRFNDSSSLRWTFGWIGAPAARRQLCVIQVAGQSEEPLERAEKLKTDGHHSSHQAPRNNKQTLKFSASSVSLDVIHVRRATPDDILIVNSLFRWSWRRIHRTYRSSSQAYGI